MLNHLVWKLRVRIEKMKMKAKRRAKPTVTQATRGSMSWSKPNEELRKSFKATCSPSYVIMVLVILPNCEVTNP